MQTAIATMPKPAKLPDGILKKALAKAKTNTTEAKKPVEKTPEAEPEFPRSIRFGFGEYPYKAMSLKDATKLHDAAVRIRGRESKLLIEDGRDFIRIKDLIQHGDWSTWLDREALLYNVKSVQRAMSVARLCEGRSKHLEALPTTCLYDLAAKSIPDAVKNAVSVEADRLGRAPDAQWVWKQISTAKAEREAKKSPKAEAAKKDVVTADPEAVQPSDDLQEVELRGQKTRDAVAMLTDALGDNFAAFVALIDAVNFMEFKSALHHARSKFAKEAA